MNGRRHFERRFPRRISTAAFVLTVLVWSATPAVAQDPQAPAAVGSVPARTVATGQSASIDLAPYFSDADGEQLAYAATVSDIAVATVAVSGDILTIAGVAPGMVVVTVFASDPGGLSATQRAEVTVEAPNQAPEPVGTIPGQTLAPGQWVSLGVSSYFSDPEGETLSFSATTSNEAVAGVAVSGDIVTITQAGTGSAIVNAVARDPGGLSAQQSVAVTAGSDPVTAARAPSEARRPEAERPRGVGPSMGAEAAAEQGADEARQPHPFPPRLLAGFVASTGYTLARGRSQVSAGYLGASPVAQLWELGDVWPWVGQASYGVTDDLTITAGSGFIYYNVGGGDSDLFPYFAPRFRAWSNEQVSVAVGGYAALLLAEETITYYGGSVAASAAVDDALGLHASAGVLGVSATILGETLTEQLGVFAAGGDFRITPEFGLAGEFRRVGFENGSNIVTGGLRVFLSAIAVEAGAAYYLEDTAEPRPIVSGAYRF